MDKDIITIDELWSKIIQYGYYVRHHGLDGLESWVVLKKSIPEIDLEWASLDKKIKEYTKLRDHGVWGEDFDPEDCKVLWENHHFLIQHRRIIKNNQTTGNLLRLLQIAYNAGQYKSGLEQKVNYLTDWMKNYYVSQKFDDMENYINDDMIKKCNDEIIKEPMKGNIVKLIDTINQIMSQKIMKGGSSLYHHNKNFYIKLSQ